MSSQDSYIYSNQCLLGNQNTALQSGTKSFEIYLGPGKNKGNIILYNYQRKEVDWPFHV